MIGEDFPKIQWDIFDLQLLEPNAMIGDIVLFAMSLFFAAQIRKMNRTQPFFKYWRLFFVWFGWSFILGGCGHLFYNYTGLWGKYPSWILGMVSTFYLAKAMISLWSDPKQKTWFTHSALALLILGILTECMVFVKVDLTIDQSKGLFVPTLVSGIGLIFSLGFLGTYYHLKLGSHFKNFWIAALILLPNAFIQNQKINLHPWFDRNDFSHVLLLLSLMLYLQGIKKAEQSPLFNP